MRTQDTQRKIELVFDLKPLRKHYEDEKSLLLYAQQTEKLLRLAKEDFDKTGAIVNTESESQQTKTKGVIEIISMILISIHVAILIKDIPSLLLRIREGFRKDFNRLKYIIKKPDGLIFIVKSDISREQLNILLEKLIEESIQFIRDTDLTVSKSKVLRYVITIWEDQENDKDK